MRYMQPVEDNYNNQIMSDYIQIEIELIDKLLKKNSPPKQEASLFGFLTSKDVIKNNKTRDMLHPGFLDGLLKNLSNNPQEKSIYIYRNFCGNVQVLEDLGFSSLAHSIRLILEQSIMGNMFLSSSAYQFKKTPVNNARYYPAGNLRNFVVYLGPPNIESQDIELIESIEHLLGEEIKGLSENEQAYLQAYKTKFYYSNLTSFELVNKEEANKMILQADTSLKKLAAYSKNIPQHLIDFTEARQINLVIQDVASNNTSENKETLLTLFKYGYKMNLLKIYSEHSSEFKQQPVKKFGPLWENETKENKSENTKPSKSEISNNDSKPIEVESNYEEYLYPELSKISSKSIESDKKTELIYPDLQAPEKVDDTNSTLLSDSSKLYPELGLMELDTECQTKRDHSDSRYFSESQQEFEPTKFEMSGLDKKYAPSAPPTLEDEQVQTKEQPSRSSVSTYSSGNAQTLFPEPRQSNEDDLIKRLNDLPSPPSHIEQGKTTAENQDPHKKIASLN